jgi:copper chaperone CopZ
LVKAKGVKDAKVSFEKKQAVVVYDPKAVTVPQIINVVIKTPHMMGGGMKYGAKIHKA